MAYGKRIDLQVSQWIWSILQIISSVRAECSSRRCCRHYHRCLLPVDSCHNSKAQPHNPCLSRPSPQRRSWPKYIRAEWFTILIISPFHNYPCVESKQSGGGVKRADLRRDMGWDVKLKANVPPRRRMKIRTTTAIKEIEIKPRIFTYMY